MAGAATIEDLRLLARKRAPRAVFDFVDGAAESELSLSRARDAFSSIEFSPRILRDVSRVETATNIVGCPSSLPLVLAPAGFTRLTHTTGEVAVAEAASSAGVPYVLSTMGTTSIESLASAAPNATLWFQLYLWKDRGFSMELVERARQAGYSALVLTVDTPVQGARHRDTRNGLTIPPRPSLRTVMDGARHPSWWFDFLTTEPLEFASLVSTDGSLADLVNRTFDPSAEHDDLEWLRGVWQGPLLVKGVLNAADAEEVVRSGADAVIVSNHGGRQLDRAPVSLEALSPIVDAVADTADVFMDGGVRSGADIAAAIGLGAKAVLVGRAYLYGLMAGGQAGVERSIEVLREEYSRTLRLLGVRSTSELDRTLVGFR